MRQAQTPQAGPEPRFSIEEVVDDGTPGSSVRPRVQEPDDFDSTVYEEVRHSRSVHRRPSPPRYRLPSPPRYSPSYIPPRTFEQYTPTPVPPPEHIPDASSVWNLHRRLYERFFTRPTISRTSAMSQPTTTSSASHKASKPVKSKKPTPPSPPPDAADSSVPINVNGVRRSTSQSTPTADSPHVSTSSPMSMPVASGSPLAADHTSHLSPSPTATATASDASTSHSNRSRSSRAETTPCASPAETHSRTSLIEEQARLFQSEEAALAEALRLSQAEAAAAPAATSPVIAARPVSPPPQQSHTSLSQSTPSASHTGSRAGSMYPTFDDIDEAELLEALRLSSEHATTSRNRS
eukprot:GILJ01010992.1.p1 GENE.GILJ01010992.1~~GILJ01010992.1.p1  ORF type:complete len:351 (-),score=34.19 GILJ01010992.1:167-1219(-)